MIEAGLDIDRKISKHRIYEIYEEKAFGVGDYYRKNFNSEAVSETHK